MAIAERASVTESIAALRSGRFRVSLRVKRVRMSTLGRQDRAVGRYEQDVVERETLAQLVFEHGFIQQHSHPGKARYPGELGCVASRKPWRAEPTAGVPGSGCA